MTITDTTEHNLVDRWRASLLFPATIGIVIFLSGPSARAQAEPEDAAPAGTTSTSETLEAPSSEIDAPAKGSSSTGDNKTAPGPPAPGASAQSPQMPAGATTAPTRLEQQPSEAKAPPPVEEIVVTGSRSTIQTSIQQKRLNNNVVEALSAKDIGHIPALSIGEALETLTSAASHREQGGATEISIRGMGPYLGSTTINGREATNGSGDRSVNFSQFPSELFTELKIYKSQEASLIEGGVSGQIALETLKPLDYGKRRLQADIKGSYHPDNANIRNNKRDWGGRLTVSLIDQFETGVLGDVGVSLGYQRRLTTNPEQEFRTTSNWRACRNDPSNTDGGVFRDRAGNCEKGAGSLDMRVDPDTGEAPDQGVPFIFVPSSRSYRQNITGDDRESFFGALQWRPVESIDINFDLQVSDRTFTELRSDLVFAEQRRIEPGLTDRTLVSARTGEVSRFENLGRIETNSTYQERIEEYRGGGLAVGIQATDSLFLSADASYSDTSRRENMYQTRLRSADRMHTSFAIPGKGSQVPLVTVQDFDVTNPDLFLSAPRTRVDLNQMRDNTIKAIRSDFELQADWGLITTLLGGARYSQLRFKSHPRARDERSDYDAETVLAANQACRNRKFPESGFLSEPSGGQDLITHVDESGNTVTSGTGSTYASFRPRCLVKELQGSLPAFPRPSPSVRNVNVNEETLAAYIQANYEGEVLGKLARGNFGVRLVNTDVTSKGLRTTFTTELQTDGTIRAVEDDTSFYSVKGGSSYTELLPSVNLALDLLDEVLLLRAAVFRGLSRPDPADLGYGRRLVVEDDDNPTSIDDLVGTANASGNPDLDPLTSWNFDLALEWYPNRDTILAGGVYYKRFIGGYENTQRVEEFRIDGQPFTADVTTSRTDSDASNIYGLELSAAHAFTYLPGALSGLGAKLGVNLAHSDFEFQDQKFGDSTVLDEHGNTVSRRIGIVEPANLFGFSTAVVSAQVYYQIFDFDLQVIYKHRSAYFQQFISTPGYIRYIGPNSVVEARATYFITKNLSFVLEGINLFDEPRVQYNPTPDNLAEVNSYGPRLFMGVRGKI